MKKPLELSYWLRAKCHQYQDSTLILRNKFGASTVQIPNMVTPKLECGNDSVFVFSFLKMRFVMMEIFPTHYHFHLEL